MNKVRGSSWARLVCSLLVAVMATGVLGVGSASAGAGAYVLYPFVIREGAAFATMVTYIGPNYNEEEDEGLHYQYFTKSSGAALNANCDAASITGASSKNDVLTYDAAGVFGIEPLFNDDTSQSFGGLGLSLSANGIGYLLINDEGGWKTAFGEAQIVDLANGGMWGYIGTSIPFGANAQGSPLVNSVEMEKFIPGIGGGAALISGTRRPVLLYPPTAATTNFITTPLGTNMRASSATNRAAFQIQLSTGTPGVYDRNENPINFLVTARVRCIAVLGYANLIGANALANPVWRENGGWAWFANVGPQAAVDPAEMISNVMYDKNAMVFKVISAGAVGAFVIDGQPVATGLCGYTNGIERVGNGPEWRTWTQCPLFKVDMTEASAQ